MQVPPFELRECLQSLPRLTELEISPLHYDVMPTLYEDAPNLQRLKFQNPRDIPGWVNREESYTDGVFCYLPKLEKLSLHDDFAHLLHFKTPHLTKFMPHSTADAKMTSLIPLAPLTRYVFLHNLDRDDFEFVCKSWTVLGRADFDNCSFYAADDKYEEGPVYTKFTANIASLRYLHYLKLYGLRGVEPMYDHIFYSKNVLAHAQFLLSQC